MAINAAVQQSDNAKEIVSLTQNRSPGGMMDLVERSQGKLSIAAERFARTPKSQGLTEMVKHMGLHQNIVRANVVKLGAGADIKKEKQKVARILESRLSQIRKTYEGFKNRRFSNRSFAVALSNDMLICGSVLTRNDNISNGEEYLDACLDAEIKDLRTGYAMTQVKIIEQCKITEAKNFIKIQDKINGDLKKRFNRLSKESTLISKWKTHQEGFSIPLADGSLLMGSTIIRLS